MKKFISDAEFDEMKELFFKGETYKEIGKRFGRNGSSVRSKLQKHEVDKLFTGANKECDGCGVTYWVARSQLKNKSFCSRTCRDKYRYYGNQPAGHDALCINCESIFKAWKLDASYCSRKCHTQHLSLTRVNDEEAEPESVTHQIKCNECGKHKEVHINRSAYCSDDCAKKFSNRRREFRRRTKMMANGKVNWDISIERLVRRDGSKCYLCDKDVLMNEDTNHELYPSIEHIKPLAKGGTHTWDNVKLAHRKCNWEKGTKVSDSNGETYTRVRLVLSKESLEAHKS